MRKISALLVVCLLLLAASLPSCVLSTQGGSSHTSALGPDSITAAETATGSTSTLASRLKSGLSYLWASYTALKQRGVKDLAKLRAQIVDFEAAIGNDSSEALALYQVARTTVGVVAAVAGAL